MKKGFVILYAVLLVSIVLIISLSLFNITYKQILVSQVNRESQHVFYAADSGLDCAKYWDKVYPVSFRPLDAAHSAFGFYGDSGNTLQAGNLSFSCVGGTMGTVSHPDGHTTKFQVEYNAASVAEGQRVVCVEVIVTKVDSDPITGVPHTSIRSDGYNVACGQVPSISFNPRGVQRSLFSYYNSF